MIEGNEYLRIDELVDVIPPYEIYRHYFGDFKLKKLYPSPFRADKKPSFGIFVGNNGILLHKDLGDSRYTGNCIGFVQQLFNLDVRGAIHKILRDIPHNTVYQKKTFEKSTPTIIQVVPRKFTSLDIQYWNSYGIGTDDLKAEDVFSVDQLFINKLRINTDELAFAYLFRDQTKEYLKIYQPYSSTHKWLSNVPVKKIFNLEKLEKLSPTVTIAKSKKDKIVLRKLITDVYEVQKEGTEVITDDLDGYFNTFYDRKVCFFDNDDPGKRANISLNPRGYGWVNIPNSYGEEGIKDPSDLVKKYGYSVLEKLLREKNLL